MRKIVGYILIGLCGLAWLIIAALPFLSLSIAQAGIWATALLIGGEISFFCGVALLGKEIIQKFKSVFKRKSPENQVENQVENEPERH